MSNWLAGIIGAAIGVLLGVIVTSCFALKAIRAAESKARNQLNDAYKDGYAFGFKAGLRRGKAMQRVDVAPGPDSIRSNSQGILDSCGEGESETAYEFEVSKLPKESWGMSLILQPKSKEDVTEGLNALIKTMERDAKQVPEKVAITVNPSKGLGFGVEFRIEWE
jgi:hypothetical protein